MIHEITNCCDCPFWDSKYSDCEHPNKPEENHVHDIHITGFDELLPDWCPLKKEDITIKLKK